MIPRARLREMVAECLGEGMDRVTPAGIRTLLDRIQAEQAEPPPGGRHALDEPGTSYQEILREFFWRMLDAPSEEAAARLWVAGFEACFGALSDMGGLTPEDAEPGVKWNAARWRV